MIADRKAKRREFERGDPEVAKRTVLVRSNPNLPANEMCDTFDREQVPLPRKWQAAGFQKWSRAYKDSNYRGRIDTIISKARQKKLTRTFLLSLAAFLLSFRRL